MPASTIPSSTLNPLLEASADPESAATSSPPRATCLHCDLPLSRARRRKGSVFCCAGCDRVHRLLAESGLDRYYELRRGPGAPPVPPGPGDFAWLDGLLPDATGAAGASRISLDIQGIHCAGCLWVLDALFHRHEGGCDLRINPALGRAEMTWDGTRSDLRGWLREAETFGYRFGPPRKSSPSGSSSLLLRLGVCAAAAMNVMVFSLCYYFGLAPGEEPLYTLFGRVSLALTALAVAVGGWVFFRGAILGLRRGVAHLDLPIAVGLLLAFLGSVLAYRRQGPEAAYFDTVTTFVTLMLVGRWLQERILERNRHALLADAGSDHLAARRFRGGALESIPLAGIEPGDEIWIVPGDVVPVAGILRGDGARLRLDWITGESDVREAAPGEAVPAGSVNAGDSVMRMEAAEPFAASRFRDLLERPSAPARRPRRDLWSRFGAAYVGAVFLLAAAAFLVWIPQGLDRTLAVTTAVLVVTCPCALGLALPLAHELTHVNLRRRGIFVRRGDFFDRARRLRTLVFDKTGTLTLGTLALDPASEPEIDRLPPGPRRILQNLTVRSNHPMSRALAEALADRTATGIEEAPAILPDLPVREIAGQGLEVEENGVRYRLGRPSFAARDGESAPESVFAAGNAALPQSIGSTLPEAAFSAGGRLLARLRFRERIRDDAREEVSRLAESGYAVHLLSGDAPERVHAVARRLGIPPERAAGGLTPEAKAAWLSARNPADTLMIGDGLNDGPAFDAAAAAATPAVEHPALPARADFYYLGEDVAAVRRTLGAARHLHRVIRGNLIFALAYNTIALSLCFLGLVTPLVAAVIMPLSSAAVVSLTAARMSPRRSPWMS